MLQNPNKTPSVVKKKTRRQQSSKMDHEIQLSEAQVLLLRAGIFRRESQDSENLLESNHESRKDSRKRYRNPRNSKNRSGAGRKPLYRSRDTSGGFGESGFGSWKAVLSSEREGFRKWFWIPGILFLKTGLRQPIAYTAGARIMDRPADKGKDNILIRADWVLWIRSLAGGAYLDVFSSICVEWMASPTIDKNHTKIQLHQLMIALHLRVLKFDGLLTVFFFLRFNQTLSKGLIKWIWCLITGIRI